MIYTVLSPACTREFVVSIRGQRKRKSGMEFDRAGFDRDVGLRLQRARKERGITQAELAKRLGLPRPSYANIEAGRQRIALDVVWRAAVVLGVSISALVPEPLHRPTAASVLQAPVTSFVTASLPATAVSSMIPSYSFTPAAEVPANVLPI